MEANLAWNQASQDLVSSSLTIPTNLRKQRELIMRPVRRDLIRVATALSLC